MLFRLSYWDLSSNTVRQEKKASIISDLIFSHAPFFYILANGLVIYMFLSSCKRLLQAFNDWFLASSFFMTDQPPNSDRSITF